MQKMFLSEKEAKKIIRENRMTRIKTSSLRYLIDYGTSSLSDIMYGITTCYIIKECNNYYVSFKVSRKDMKDALHSLLSNGYIEFIGGHKWKATQSGIDQLEKHDWV